MDKIEWIRTMHIDKTHEVNLNDCGREVYSPKVVSSKPRYVWRLEYNDYEIMVLDEKGLNGTFMGLFISFESFLKWNDIFSVLRYIKANVAMCADNMFNGKGAWNNRARWGQI